MTYFIKLENNTPVGSFISEDKFRELFPQFPNPVLFVAEEVEPLGYGIFDFSNKPEHTPNEKAVEMLPVRNEFGIWRQTWEVVPKSIDELPPPMPQDGRSYVWNNEQQQWICNEILKIENPIGYRNLNI